MEHLPVEFLRRMKSMLGSDFTAFENSYEQPRSHGLRVNTLKLEVNRFTRLSPFSLEPVPWSEAGFYYWEEDRPGRHPYHAAGLYYIQEPSAMAVAEVLAPKPGERVLDLCAAPGGKATHLAALMKGEGLLIANEIHSTRAKILAENIERLGIRHALVTNESPARLAERWPGFFDRILVDAPCSGEGMFRKDPEACSEWSADIVSMCAQRQLKILNSADALLRPQGYLAYATCTFSPEENEGVLEKFLQAHPYYSVESVTMKPGFAPGCPQWSSAREELSGTIRIWPHRAKGEGHFIALLQKKEDSLNNVRREIHPLQTPAAELKQKLPHYYSFAGEYLEEVPEGDFLLFGDNLYLSPKGFPVHKGLRVIRPGWHLGVFKKNRFEPSHALAMALPAKSFRVTADFNPEAEEVRSYLQGEAIGYRAPKGWIAVTVSGYPLGWGKSDGMLIKNHYPKGLRMKF